MRPALPALLLAVVSLAGCQGDDEQLSVTTLSWERTVVIEKAVLGAAWRDEVPAGARVFASTSMLHHLDRKQTGTRSVRSVVADQAAPKGARELVETMPVYEETPVQMDWCRFETGAWTIDRKENTSGEGAPEWPAPRLEEHARLGARTERYRASFLNAEGQAFDADLALADWQRLAVGRPARARVVEGAVVALLP